jgi:hypothetical protein
MKSGGGGRVKLGDSQNDQCVTLQQIRCHEVGRTGDLVLSQLGYGLACSWRLVRHSRELT